MSKPKRVNDWVIETGQCVRDDGALAYCTNVRGRTRNWRACSPRGDTLQRSDSKVRTFATATAAMLAVDAAYPRKTSTRVELEMQLLRANRIIGWMMPYIGTMCPPPSGLHDLNIHCCENDVPEPGDETKGRPINQKPARK